MGKKISNKKLTWILVVIFVLISLYPLFAFLGTQPLRTWDESRVAASSYEMTKTKNPIVVTYDYKPDHWSVKPPLAIWIQALSIKVFGANEVAVRLPSALAILLMGVVIILLTGVIKKPFLGFYAASVIICSRGFFIYHSGRSADYDALLCFFMIAYLLLFFIYTETKEKKYYILFFVSLIFATLTKGIQALMPLPFIPIYLIFRKQLLPILKDKTTYIGIGLFILFVGGYYIGRELSYGGYLKAVYENELGGRFMTVLENNSGGKCYYINNLKTNYFTYFFYILPLAFIFTLFVKDKQVKRLSIFSMSIAIMQYVFLLIAKTKLHWYLLPLMPLFALVIGSAFYVIHNWIINLKYKTSKIYILIIVAYIAVFSIPYKRIVKHIYRPKEDPLYQAYYSRSELMKSLLKGNIVVNDTINYINGDYDQSSMFYFYAMNHYDIHNQRKNIEDLKLGDLVQINEIETDEKIMERFEYEVLHFKIQSKIVRLTKLLETQNM